MLRWRRDISAGTVTSVTGTAPIASSGGATPAISIDPLFTIPRVAAGGTVDAITANFVPDITLGDTQMVAVVSGGANTSATPTFAPDGLTARTITARGGAALNAGDIGPAGFVMLLEYNLAGTRWELLNPNMPYLAAAGFTPAVAFGGSSTGVTYAARQGYLSRIGDRAFFELTVVLSSKGAQVGAATVTGLPVASNAASLNVAAITISNADAFAATAITQLGGYISAGGSVINLTRYAAGAQTLLPDSDFTNNTQFTISGCYRV